MRQTAKRVTLSENCSEVSVLLRCGERLNIKINEDDTQPIYFSHRLRPLEASLTLNGRNIPFVNHVKYLGVILDKMILWRLQIEIIETKAFRTVQNIYKTLLPIQK
jgi:hypothetical protein